MAWIFYWSIFAVGQLSTTIQHMNWYGEYVLGVKSQEIPLVLEEKLNNQLVQLLQLKKLINKINPTAKKLSVTLGSLVKTNHGWLHISVPLGNLKIDETNIMVVSLVSPIGQILQNKNAGESVQFNGKKWEILRVL